MRERTRAKWAERIREWRESGKSAEEFAAGKDYGASGLRWAASQMLAKEEAARTASAPASRGRRAVDSAGPAAVRAPRIVPLRVRRVEPVAQEIIIEVGGARIRVTRGVDVALLGDVVRALHGVGQ
jgi:hypothetical protein